MIIQKCELIKQFKDGTPCNIQYIELIIDNIQDTAENMISIITADSWISDLDPICKVSYQYKVKNTSKKLTEIFQNQIESPQQEILNTFGEYMISIESGEALKQSLNHKVFPLAELWKEKLTGNSGFDFHTETPDELIAFGEAKYRSSGNAYRVAAEQIQEFIQPEIRKDLGDASFLRDIRASQNAIQNLINNKRDFILAYSMNSSNFDIVKNNCLNDSVIKELEKETSTLFLIGVHII